MWIVLLTLILAVGVVILLIEGRPNLFVFQLIEKIFGSKGKAGDKPDNKK
ncbi:MAG: hypothetical protein HY755_05340 [Nitrospirae bacterium]|nr:hypothetical protein [Nitrospirota bacterium]